MDSWQLMKSGKQEGLKQIYDRLSSLLLNYGLKFNPDKEAVEDAIHDLFVYIWDKRQSINCNQSIEEGYLCLSLKRNLIRKNNTKIVSFDYLPLAIDIENVEEKIVHQETETLQNHQLHQAVGNLTERQKEALYLKYNQNMDYEQVGQVLEMNYQSCRNLIYRAITELRAQLKNVSQ